MTVTITTPDAVPGEVIEAAWGDAVRADLNALNAGKINDTGDTMTGTLNMTGAANQVIVEGSVRAGGDATAGATGIMLLGSLGRIVASAGSAAESGTWDRNGGGAAAGAVFHRFARLGVTVGAITMPTTASTAYVTSSDERQKRRDGDLTDAAERVQRLGAGVFRGRWMDPDTAEPVGDTWDLLYAHDVAAEAPYAVTGERGAVAANGDPIFQQVNYPGLVPLLVAALANALDRIDTLEAAGV